MTNAEWVPVFCAGVIAGAWIQLIGMGLVLWYRRRQS